jgi:hypothetical protein
MILCGLVLFISYTTENLAQMGERDNRWIALVSDVRGLAVRDIEHNIATGMGRDNMLLATLIHVSPTLSAFVLIGRACLSS